MIWETLGHIPTPQLAAFVAGGLVLNFAPGQDVFFATACGVQGGPRAGALVAASSTIELGGATALGRMLTLVPRAVSTAPWFCAVSDPIARVTAAGVRIAGTPASAAGSPASRLRTVKSAASARA